MNSRNTLARFIVVGVTNTLIDFGLLLWLTSFDFSLLGANMIATGAALTFSFFANRKFTFRSDGNVSGQVVKFLVVTLVGLWVLQPLVLYSLLKSLTSLLGSQAALVVAKLIASVVSMTWNFILYKRMVFNDAPQ